MEYYLQYIESLLTLNIIYIIDLLYYLYWILIESPLRAIYYFITLALFSKEVVNLKINLHYFGPNKNSKHENKSCNEETIFSTVYLRTNCVKQFAVHHFGKHLMFSQSFSSKFTAFIDVNYSHHYPSTRSILLKIENSITLKNQNVEVINKTQNTS